MTTHLGTIYFGKHRSRSVPQNARYHSLSEKSTVNRSFGMSMMDFGIFEHFLGSSSNTDDRKTPVTTGHNVQTR
jgi:hypothetical protein